MLKRIEVNNFKSLKHLDYECAKLNLLTGLNGAGKSSFVQLLLLMREASKEWSAGGDLAHVKVASFGTYNDLRYCYASPGDKISFATTYSRRCVSDVNDLGQPSRVFDAFFDDLSGDKKGDLTILRELADLEDDSRFVSIVHPAYDAFRQSKELREYTEFLNEHGGRDAIEEMSREECYEPFLLEKMERVLHERSKAIRKEVRKTDSEAAEFFEQHWKGLKMVDAFRIKPKAVHKGCNLSEKKFDVGQGFDPEGGDVFEVLYKYGRKFRISKNNPMLFPDDKHIKDEYRDLIDQVNFWLEVVSPGAVVKVDKTELGDEDRYLASVCFEEGTSGLSRAFKPQNVGFGISYILPVLVTVLTAKPEDIVIIENPEAHLHPKGQAKMGELLARAAAYGVQLFVETHSDHVINGIRVAVADKLIQPGDVNIAFFERMEHSASRDDGSVATETYAEVCNVKVDGKGALSEYPDGFMDEWGNQLLELL